MPDSTIPNLPESTTGPGASVAVGSFSGITKKITFTNLAAALALLITGLVAGTTIDGKQVCLQDGTNCPTISASSGWSDDGSNLIPATNTRGLIVYGGATSSNLTATGTTSLQGVSFTSGTGTSLQVTSGTIATLGFGKATGTDIFATTLRSASFSANATGATSTNIYWSAIATGTTLNANTATFGALTVGGQSICLANGTNCPFATIAITNTGTATASAVTPDALAGSYAGTKSVILYVSSSTTGNDEVNNDVGTSTCLTVPQAVHGMVLVTASSTHRVAGAGNFTKINVRNQTRYLNMLTTDIHINGGATTSWSATTGTVINTGNATVYAGNIVCADVLAVDTTPAKESQVVLEFRLP